MDASREVVSYAAMDPVLWGSLPRELLVLVLERLLVPVMSRLRCHLSKEWTLNMEFNRACDEANPNMVAFVSYAEEANEFSVRIFDFSKHVWLYEYHCRLRSPGNAPKWFDSIDSFVWMPMASDGGLVCFVSTWKYTKANPLCIVVINPLTRVQHELPPLQHVYTVPPTLVHMKMDSESQGYKVVVVDKKEGCCTIETYDSISRQWSRSAPSWGCIFGIARKWILLDGFNFILENSSPCACDLEDGKRDVFALIGVSAMQDALAGDRIFVLHKKKYVHDIKSVICFVRDFLFKNLGKHDTGMVCVRGQPYGQYYSQENGIFEVFLCKHATNGANQLVFFPDFPPNEWHMLPLDLVDSQHVSEMFRVFWHVIP